MSPLALISTVVVAVLVLVALSRFESKRSSKGAGPAPSPYQKKPLFTPAEQSFLRVLNRAIDDDAIVMAKVRIADLLKPRSGLSQSERVSALNRIDRKHVDFVLCDPDKLSVLAAVELDDRSHARDNRKTRDNFVERAFHAAGLPLLRFPVQSGYTLSDIRDTISPFLTVSASASNETSTDAAPSMVEANALTCPKCGGALVERVSGRGAKEGARFLGCDNFPSCRYTQELN